MIKEISSSNLQQAHEYQCHGISAIPLVPKIKTSVHYEQYRRVQADEEELRRWFEKRERNHEIAIVTSKVSGVIELDIDSEGTIIHFDKETEIINDRAIRSKIKNTMKIKTASGSVNDIFGLDAAHFADGNKKKTSVLWRGREYHSEICVKADGAYGTSLASTSGNPSDNRSELAVV
jgi:Bifunctional DNA primase/polymerase, N-terminal